MQVEGLTTDSGYEDFSKNSEAFLLELRREVNSTTRDDIEEYFNEIYDFLQELGSTSLGSDAASNLSCIQGASQEEVDLFETVGFYLEFVLLISVAVLGVVANSVAIPILLSKKV